MEQPLLYTATRFLTRVALRIYFRAIEVTGRENVPRNGPVILAANHPQSITDALILGTATSRMVHCIAHSGLFRHRVVGWLLRRLGAIPPMPPS